MKTKKILKKKELLELKISNSKAPVSNITIEAILAKLNDKEYDYDTLYQRGINVWENDRKSKLIDSIIRGFYIPTVVVRYNGDDTYDIIDGCQRLSTIEEFTNNKFKLRGLDPLNGVDLNGKSFKDLCTKSCKAFKSKTLAVAELDENTDEIETFIRLQNGRPLTKPELLSAYLFGSPILLKTDDILYIKENSALSKLSRKKGMTAILNSLLCLDQGYSNTAMSKKYVESINLICSKGDDHLSKLVQRLMKTIKTIDFIMGDDKFKKFNLENGKLKTSKAVSVVVALHQILAFSNFSDKELKANKDAVKLAVIKELTFNKDDQSTQAKYSLNSQLKGGQNNPDHIKYSTECLKSAIKKSLSIKIDPSRNFSMQVKTNMFNKNDNCGICDNSIEKKEHVNIDHIIPHSKGGQTTITNAQLSHSYCNQSKGNMLI